jgi:AcrR family transcriptional regulator
VPETHEPATQTRRHGEELEQAILKAVWAELIEVGYAKMTIEGVAARAGTSKPVIYRRWARKPELVLAAWQQRLPAVFEPPESTDLRTDLLRLFRRLLHRFDDIPPDVLAGLTTETFRDPEVFALLREQLSRTVAHPTVDAVVQRAVARGELGPVTLTTRVATLPLTLIRAEALMSMRGITDDTITEILDDVFLPLLRGLAAS